MTPQYPLFTCHHLQYLYRLSNYLELSSIPSIPSFKSTTTAQPTAGQLSATTLQTLHLSPKCVLLWRSATPVGVSTIPRQLFVVQDSLAMGPTLGNGSIPQHLARSTLRHRGKDLSTSYYDAEGLTHGNCASATRPLRFAFRRSVEEGLCAEWDIILSAW